MPRNEFDRELRVAATPAECWATLTDVPVLVDWMSILEDARELEPLLKYTATLLDRVGPFKLRADLNIVLSDVKPDQHVSVRADGEDRQVGSRLAVEASLDLRPTDQGTTVRVTGAYEVTGRVAAISSGTITKKADKILEEFFARARQALGAP